MADPRNGLRRYLAPVRAFVGLWIVLKICDRMADTVLCTLAIVGGFEMDRLRQR
jgi:hypothetical protein